MPLDPGGDRPHAPEDDARWIESWGFSFANGVIRLTLVPAARVCSWWTLVSLPEVGTVVVRDDELPRPGRADSLEIRGEGLWGELVCETAFEHWGIALEAFGLRVDTPDDETGERLPVGLDLEWELTGPPTVHHVDGGTRHTQAGVLHGELLVAEHRIPIDTPCTRDHLWGRVAPPTWPS